MNFKKIGALSLAMVLSLSSMVSATNYNSTEEYEAAMANYSPKLSISVSQEKADSDTIKTTAGMLYWMQYNNGGKNSNDYYKVTFKFTNLGELKNGFNSTFTGMDINGISGITVFLGTDKIVSAAAANNDDLKLSYATGIGVDEKGIGKSTAFKFNSAGKDNPYPAFNSSTGVSINNYDGDSFTMDFIVAIAQGTSVKVTNFKANVVYTDGTYGANKYITDIAPITIGTPASTVKDWDIKVTEKQPGADETWNGYIWEVTATPGDGKLTKFDVTFKDSKDVSSSKKSIENYDVMNDWNTATTFNIGLVADRTEHPDVTPTWDIGVTEGNVKIN